MAGALGLAGIAPLGGANQSWAITFSPTSWPVPSAAEWTPALHLLLGLLGSSLWGKELRDMGKHWGGERQPSDQAGRTWCSGRPSQWSWEGGAGWVLAWEGPTVTLAGLGLRGQWSQSLGPGDLLPSLPRIRPQYRGPCGSRAALLPGL